MERISRVLQGIGLLAILLAMPTVVEAQYTLTTNNGAITIAAYVGSGGVAVIPSTTNGLPVTSIGADAFVNNSLITSVTIPNTVTNIGTSAFANCQKLTNVTLGNGITSIADHLFSQCYGLNNITIPNTVTSIGQMAFSGTSLTKIIIPGSVTSIATQAFALSYGLSAAYFLGNAPSVGNLAFEVNTMTVYYQPFTSGWSNTFAGWPTATWIPPLPALGIAIYSNQPVVFFPSTFIGTNFIVQMKTNLASTNWVTVTNGVSYIGVQIPNAPSNAFFRIQ